MSQTPPLQGGFFASAAISVAFGHQTKTATGCSQPRVNPRLRALNIQEGGREQRGESVRNRAVSTVLRGCVFKRKGPENLADTRVQARKKPNR